MKKLLVEEKRIIQKELRNKITFYLFILTPHVPAT